MCLLKRFNGKRLRLLDLEFPFSRKNKLDFRRNINWPNGPLGLIGSCNGLVCLGEYVFCDESKVFCNIFISSPVLKEYITLPHTTKGCHYSYACAFGFSHVTNQYKVVISSYIQISESYNTYIYTLGEGSWRNMESAYGINNTNYNAFFNGALHWIEYGPYICCFDFLSEEFHAFPEPSGFNCLINHELERIRMCVINDCLAVCGCSYNMVIWVMKEYGVKESWSKDFVITLGLMKYEVDTFEPILINGNGEILIIFNNESIMVYNPVSEARESKRKIFGVSSEFQAIAHVPSLISLKDVAKGENLKVLG